MRAPETKARDGTRTAIWRSSTKAWAAGAIGGHSPSTWAPSTGARRRSAPTARGRCCRRWAGKWHSPSIVVDVTPPGQAAEPVRQANCAVSTKIKIKPGTTKPLAAVYGKLRKDGRTSTSVPICYRPGPTLEHAFVSPEPLVRADRNYSRPRPCRRWDRSQRGEPRPGRPSGAAAR